MTRSEFEWNIFIMMLTPCNCNNYMTSSRTVEGGKKDGMLSELCITAYSSFQLSELTDIIVSQYNRDETHHVHTFQ